MASAETVLDKPTTDTDELNHIVCAFCFDLGLMEKCFCGRHIDELEDSDHLWYPDMCVVCLDLFTKHNPCKHRGR